jgi:hypothetical protein
MKLLYLFLTLFILLLGCEKGCYDCPECIIGEWQLISRCGGITGECWYPDKDHQVKVVFTPTNKYFRYSNGEKIIEYNYELGTTMEIDGVKYYEITFIPPEGVTDIFEWSTEFWFSDKKYVNIPGGDFVDKFERTK